MSLAEYQYKDFLQKAHVSLATVQRLSAAVCHPPLSTRTRDVSLSPASVVDCYHLVRPCLRVVNSLSLSGVDGWAGS